MNRQIKFLKLEIQILGSLKPNGLFKQLNGEFLSYKTNLKKCYSD